MLVKQAPLHTKTRIAASSLQDTDQNLYCSKLPAGQSAGGPDQFRPMMSVVALSRR